MTSEEDSAGWDLTKRSGRLRAADVIARIQHVWEKHWEPGEEDGDEDSKREDMDVLEGISDEIF